MRVGGAQSRWVPFVHCVQSARKEGGGVLDAEVPSFNVRPGLQAGEPSSE